MTFFALITAAYRNVNAAIKRRRTYYQLRNLSSLQLKDIGLRIENGRIVSDAGTPDTSGQRRHGFRTDRQEINT